MKYISITDGWGFFQVQFWIFTPLLLLSHVACFSGWQEGGGEELTTCVPIITLTTVLVHLTRSPVLCLLSVFILLRPASFTCLWALPSAGLESKAANTMLTTWNPLTLSLRGICPATSLVQDEQRLKQSSPSFIKPNKPTAFPSGAWDTSPTSPKLFRDRVEAKKEKA